MVRTPCCKAEGLKKGAWTPEEDQKLIAYVNEHGEGGWRTLPEKAGLKRCGKSCRLRWANYLRPDIKRGEFSEEDEEIIIRLHATHGNKWSAIARRLPGRTDNEIKNYWNTHIKKRLIKKGIDPLTHKPISEKSDTESYRKFEKDDQETAEEKSQGQDLEHQKPPLSLSAKFLNKVANKFARRVNQSVLTEIIEGGSGTRNIFANNNDDNNIKYERSSSSSTSTSNLLNNITRLQFDGECRPSSTSTSTSTFSDSSASVNGVPSGNEYNDNGFNRFLNGISNDEDLMGDNSNVENGGFMNELTKMLEDDGLYEIDLTMVNDRNSYIKGSFEDIESYWEEYMDLDSY